MIATNNCSQFSTRYKYEMWNICTYPHPHSVFMSEEGLMDEGHCTQSVEEHPVQAENPSCNVW